MKKLLCLLIMAFQVGNLFAQVPQKMSYQAVVRDISDKLVANRPIGMRISILQYNATGPAVYVETHSAVTNANGLVSLELGAGHVITGSFSGINWSEGHFFLKTETDPTGGSTYAITSTTQLLSVPYALHAGTAETLAGGINEKDPLFTKSQAFNITPLDILNLSHLDGINTGDQDLSTLAAKRALADSTAKLRSEIPSVAGFLRTETDPRYAADSSFIKMGTRSWNGSLAKKISANDTAYWGRAETDPLFFAWDRTTGIRIRENQITDLDHFTNGDEIDPRYATDSAFVKTGIRSWNSSLAKKISTADTAYWGRAETDPLFSAWDKSSGINIRENQITDLDHFTNGDEIDPRYATDSAFVKTGIRSWNSSLAKKISTTDTAYWGRAETDPLFSAWDKSTGINIRESQISDLDHFTNTDEIDPRYAIDSAFVKTAIRSWNSSLAKKISEADTAYWGRVETDPLFSAWDKSTGINISESQITDLDHFTNADEIDPRYATDSAYVKTGIRSWNRSLAKKISEADTAYWGRAETDPLFFSWDRTAGITIYENQIIDLVHFTNADEIDPVYAADSTEMKTDIRSWNNSLAKTITPADTTHWGSAETDPIYSAAPASGITAENITSWNAKSEFSGNYSNLTNAPDIANSTLNKSISLETGGTLAVKNGANTYLTVKQSTGLIGIGSNATDPRAALEIGGTDGLLVRGTVNSGTIRALGAGMRFHWYPRKGAFRVGMAESSYWDDDGTSYPKMALYSIGMGYQPRASGVASTAIGAYNQATGDYALALGSYSQATASHAIAIGTQAYATGIYSIAIGSGANTNGRDGSMVIGDDTYFQTAYSTADNQLTMRFSGGYRLWSSYPDSTSGVYMRHGQNGWSNYCDRNKKENFRQLDYEEILGKIKEMPVTEWNYIGIGDQKYIGPMAQDFYAAFQLNGTDSLGINSISIDGVNMVAVKGLIQRTDELKKALEELKLQKEKVTRIEAMLDQQNAIINDMKKDLMDLKNSLAK